MLVLRRKANEWIDIGNDISIRVVGKTGKHFILGIEAPKDTLVLRRELRQGRRGDLKDASNAKQ